MYYAFYAYYEISHTWIIFSAKTSFFEELMFKLPMIVLLKFFTLCCLTFLISFKKASEPFEERELLSFWTPWSIYHSMLVKKVLKFITRIENLVSFKCSLFLFKGIFELIFLFRINGIASLPRVSPSILFTSST